jgi:O-antigen biosynthesis protein WbqP
MTSDKNITFLAKANTLKRAFDLLLCLGAAFVLFIPIIFLCVLIKLTSQGPVIYWSDRVGRFNKIFSMPKFRSMKINAPSVATHLLENPAQWLTPVGSFLRKTSLDEVPQLFSILKGDMSFVGPRPALFNQQDLIDMRTELGVDSLVPGLTGWAQINGRDELSIDQKVKLDFEYLQRQSLGVDIKIIWLTFLKVSARDGVTH